MVKPKKHLGQHFLIDEQIAEDTVRALTRHQNYQKVLELGAGTGVLTKYLLQNSDIELSVIEIDAESIAYLQKNFSDLEGKIYSEDFLNYDLQKIYQEPFALVGNFPYNISSQIFFKVLEYREQIPEIVCMLQKEVAERLCSPPNSKKYGILSVFLQAFYDTEYLFTVPAEVFDPPPKVQSAVIRLQRNERKELDCDEKRFKSFVKQSFNNRRKMLRNTLKAWLKPETKDLEILQKRPEQLSVDEFVALVKTLS